MNLAQASKDLPAIQGQIPGFKFASSTIGDILSALLPYIFAISGVLLLFFLVSGGIKLMTSRGDPKGIAQANSQIMFAVIGFLIVFAAYWITQLAGLTLNLKGITDIFK